MYKSKSILLLKSFTAEELRRFGDFLNSPYYNKNSRVTRLFGELKKYYPEFVSKGAEKENLYKKLFPGKTYNEQVMKNLISELLRLEKEFLAADWFNNDTNEKSLSLISKLLTKPADPIFNKEVENFENSLEHSSATSIMVNLYRHLLEEKKFAHNIINNRQSVASGNIEKSGEYLTVFFLRSILILSINNHINQFSFNLNIEKNFPDKLINSLELEKLLQYMESLNIKETLSIKLAYYALVSIMNVSDDKQYRIYHDLLYENLDSLSREDTQRFLHFMESICAQKINSGRTEIYNDLFETYVHELTRDAHSPDPESMTVLKFRNIFLTAIRVKEYDWAEKFINDYKGKLHKENRKNVVELATAQLNFERGFFDKSLEHLNKIKTDQIYFKIDIRSLNLMCFYELGHYESALSLIESFRRMLNSSPSLTGQYSEKNINFVNSLGGLIKLRTEYDKDTAAKLIEKIKGHTILSNRSWLTEKFNELEREQ